MKVLTVAILLIAAGGAVASDWQFSGSIPATKNKGGSVAFFDAQSVSQSQDTVRVWSKTILQKDAQRYVLEHDAEVVDWVGRRLEKKQIPRYLEIESVRSGYTTAKDFAGAVYDVATYEAAANAPATPVEGRAYLEIDCSARRAKFLEITTFSSGRPVTETPTGPGLFIAPDTQFDLLASMLCPQK